MEFKIENTQVYGFKNSVIKSGNPLRTSISTTYAETDLKRALKLATTPNGTGHDQFLTGIIVQFDIYAPLYMWKEIQRYHFLDYVSSQSTMHCITKFNISEQCNKFVWETTKTRLTELVENYKISNDKNTWYEIISNLPSGFILGASMTTNYRQLKTIYQQRKNHKLDEWKEFCKWINELPFGYLITGEKENDE